MLKVPAHLAAAAFDGILTRGDIIHFSCTFDDGSSKNKFAVVLNRELPEDPILHALFTSQVGFYSKTTMYDRDIIRVAANTYQFLQKDTIINFRDVRKADLDELRTQYGDNRLTIPGRLLKVHLDHVDRILRDSLLIEGWKIKRCTPAQPQ